VVDEDIDEPTTSKELEDVPSSVVDKPDQLSDTPDDASPNDIEIPVETPEEPAVTSVSPEPEPSEEKPDKKKISVKNKVKSKYKKIKGIFKKDPDTPLNPDSPTRDNVEPTTIPSPQRDDGTEEIIEPTNIEKDDSKDLDLLDTLSYSEEDRDQLQAGEEEPRFNIEDLEVDGEHEGDVKVNLKPVGDAINEDIIEPTQVKDDHSEPVFFDVDYDVTDSRDDHIPQDNVEVIIKPEEHRVSDSEDDELRERSVEKLLTTSPEPVQDEPITETSSVEVEKDATPQNDVGGVVPTLVE
jgi:hypothetical protein